MSLHRTAFRFFCWAALASSSAVASADELEIWVAPGLYGVSESNCSPLSKEHDLYDAATRIDVRLCPVFSSVDATGIAAQFKQEMKERFPGRVQEVPGASLPSSVPLDQRLRSTLAASLHVSRADIWQVSKHNSTSVVYLPVTLSLLLTNISTGQVVFTETLSTIAPFTAEDRNIEQFARQNLPPQLRAVVSELVQKAAARFSPYPVSATIKGTADKAYVIDKGKSSGIRRGDLFQGDAKVLFADADYAIVDTINPNERLKVETVLSKQNVQPAEYLAKHPAMVTIGMAPSGMSPAYLKRVFEGKLGSTKVFNIATVNPSIESIRRATASEAKSDANSNDRELPEYFVHLQSFVLEPTEFPTSIPGRTLKTYEAYSIAYIADRSGRVIYSQTASDRLTDETSGVGFAREQRQEAVVLNSIDKLVSLIGLEFKPSSLRLPVSKIGGEVVVQDPVGALSNGATGTVLRKAGQVGGIKGAVWVPVNESRAVRSNDHIVLAQLDPLDRAAGNGDVFAVEGGGERPSSSLHAYGSCPAPVGLAAGDYSADPLFRAIGAVRFQQATRVPLYISEMPVLLRRALRTFKGQGEGLGITEGRSPDMCIKTIFRATRVGPAGAKGGLQSERYNLSLGYNLLNDKQERVAGYGMSVELVTSPLSPVTELTDVEMNAYRDFIGQLFASGNAIATNISLQK